MTARPRPDPVTPGTKVSVLRELQVHFALYLMKLVVCLLLVVQAVE